MILGKQLLDNGQTHDAKGLPIDPDAPYEASINGGWYRAGLLARALRASGVTASDLRILSRQGPVGGVGRSGVPDSNRGAADETNGRGDTV